MAVIRASLEDHGMEVDEAPDDDELRQTYNFAPGYYGPVYRGEIDEDDPEQDGDNRQEPPEATAESENTQDEKTKKPTYKLQKMRWGLIPSWTKRQVDYGSMMRTINCRADSLIEDRGMWTSMKRRKRCVVVCQGFYEWLKKGPGGKERVPHYTKRKDGGLMWFAGLWDCVQYEGSDEKLYTYTIITTESNPYLKFLHDRMPVILEPGSEQMKAWLDPHQTTWTPQLQSILKPYDGELECYPVSKEVGKVGNNSPDFIVPVNSKENKNNIANFFANATKKKDALKSEMEEAEDVDHAKHDQDNAPQHAVPLKEAGESPRGTKRELQAEEGDDISSDKVPKVDQSSPVKHTSRVPGRPMRSATTNKSSPRKGKNYGTKKQASDGSQRITNFFK
ncbi:putative protein YMR114C [Talaromyces islandicus]|uniref:DUF159 domain protein n=1 Tax=Talaromyces islandicus TaxID=28573 RepID=A0A0U1LVJ6_TALIS|nr:putative protein YMR114C [Talaromyces islandicus]